MEIKKSHLKIAGIGGIFIAAFVFGATLHCLKDRAAVSTSAPVESQAGNWGLGFGESGTQPTGNASPEELKTYHAAYCDPTDEKVIYLTFDA